MTSRLRSKSGLAALLIALALGLFLAWSQESIGPSRAELARALSVQGNRIGPDDLRSVRCEENEAGFACDWRQREDGGWRDQAAQLQVRADGWHVLRGNMP